MTDKNLVINYTTGDPSTTRININDLIDIQNIQTTILDQIKATKDWDKVSKLGEYTYLESLLNKLNNDIGEFNTANQTDISKVQTDVKKYLLKSHELQDMLNIQATQITELLQANKQLREDHELVLANNQNKINKADIDKINEQHLNKIQDFIRNQGTTLLGNPVTKVEIQEIKEINTQEAKKKYLKYKMKYLLLKQSLNDKNI